MKLVFALVFFTSSIAILSSGNVSALSNFNVLDYGAVGDGKTDDSQAFLTAWNHVCEAMEGIPTLQVPTGKTYMLNPLKFLGPCRSKQIHFDLGGTVMAPSKDGWPSNDDKDKWVQFCDVDGLTLKGSGQFDGQGSFWWKDCTNKHCPRPTALFFHNCNGLQVSKMKHVNSGKNHISINVCDDVMISDIHISAPEDSPNTDGIDISKSNNVIIQHSSMATGDDCIAINTGSTNINILNVTCGPGHGISIGSLGEDSDYNIVENIYVSDCVLKSTENGVRIKTWENGNGHAKNITFEKITLTSVKNPIIIDQHYTSYAYSRKKQAMGIKVSDVTYREVKGTSADENAIVLNCSQTRCTNIIMDDVSIKASTPEKEAVAVCKNVDGQSKSVVVPIVSCLSNSQYMF